MQAQDPFQQGCGIKGFLPTSVRHFFHRGLVFGKPFLLYHKSGHVPQPGFPGEKHQPESPPCFGDHLLGTHHLSIGIDPSHVARSPVP